MKTRALLVIATLLIVALALAAIAAGNVAANPAGGGITVIDADSRQDVDYLASGNLTQLTAAALPRIFLQWANAQRIQAIVPPSDALIAKLSSATPRIFLQWANTQRQLTPSEPSDAFLQQIRRVTPRIFLRGADSLGQQETALPSTTFLQQIRQVTTRIFLRGANAARQEPLTYPLSIIDDQAGPRFQDISATPSYHKALISWTTNEFARSEVHYGTEPGVYPNAMAEPLYALDHAFLLLPLPSGVTYYYIVISTDRSGNSSQSVERNFTTQTVKYLYLPVLMQP